MGCLITSMIARNEILMDSDNFAVWNKASICLFVLVLIAFSQRLLSLINLSYSAVAMT